MSRAEPASEPTTGKRRLRAQEGGWNDDGGGTRASDATPTTRGASNLGRLKLRASARAAGDMEGGGERLYFHASYKTTGAPLPSLTSGLPVSSAALLPLKPNATTTTLLNNERGHACTLS